MTLFVSIATLFLSVAVVVIAWQQWRIADNKLRLDLFDRRYKVYEATRKFLAVIISEATFTQSQLVEFDIGTSDAEFLFEADVVNYLKQIRERALHMRTACQLLERSQATPAKASSNYGDSAFNSLPRQFMCTVTVIPAA